MARCNNVTLLWRLILQSSLLLILMACNKPNASVANFRLIEHPASKQSIDLELVQNLSLYMDDKSLPFYDLYQIYTEGEEQFLVGFNRQRLSLDFIPFAKNNPEACFHLTFEEEGPGAVDADLDIFHVFSRDSIVTLVDRERKFQVFSVKKGYRGSYPLKLVDDKGANLYPVSAKYAGQDPFFLPHFWVLPVYPDVPVKSKAYYHKHRFAVVDPKKGEVLQTFGTYPERYKKDRYFDVLREPALTHTKENTFLVTFPAEPSIYAYTVGEEEIKQHVYAAWNSIHNNGVEFQDDMQKFVNHYTASPWFQRLLYDPYRNLYYRFFKESSDLRKVTGEKITPLEASWTLYILNEKLDIVGKTPIDTPSLNPQFSFVTEKGLHIMYSYYEENKIFLSLYLPYDKSPN
ncbi:MAG: DUF4221 family protein [Nitritalea sp.]